MLLEMGKPPDPADGMRDLLCRIESSSGDLPLCCSDIRRLAPGGAPPLCQGGLLGITGWPGGDCWLLVEPLLQDPSVVAG